VNETTWHPSAAFGPPFYERKDIDLGATVVMLRLTAQQAVADVDLANPTAVAYLKSHMFASLKDAYYKAESTALKEAGK
jgi:hypothetical protein